MRKEKNAYHHGNLAESLLNAVDDIASQFGLEAVTLRGCAKAVGVSPSSAFRHYSDKRALLTAFAARALRQLAVSLQTASKKADRDGRQAFPAVCNAYISFAIEKPAFFRAMWREEIIYTSDDTYLEALELLMVQLKGGFADSIADSDPTQFSDQETLAWSSVHGLANLFVDGPLGGGKTSREKLTMADSMIQALLPAFAN